MKRWTASLVVTSWLLGSLLDASAAPEPRALAREERTRLSMGCAYTIIAYGPAADTLGSALEAALDEVDRIDRLMSHYKPDSPLSRLNREAANGPVNVPPELFDFLAECLRYGRDSDGAFDITVGPLMKAWGFFYGDGRVPSAEELASARRSIGYRHVILDRRARMVRFDRPGVELDLGGIAKGYAVDRAIGLLRAHGVTAALVSAGGSTLYGLGAPPGEPGWSVAIQDPTDERKTALETMLRDRALSIAGRAHKSFEAGGVTYSHIMDPRRGRPVQGVLSVAVWSQSATAGDALDDVFFVEGVERARDRVRRLPSTAVAFFLPAAAGWKMVRLGH